MTAKRAVTLVKKVTYFGEFGYLNSSCIRQSIDYLLNQSGKMRAQCVMVRRPVAQVVEHRAFVLEAGVRTQKPDQHSGSQ